MLVNGFIHGGSRDHNSRVYSVTMSVRLTPNNKSIQTDDQVCQRDGKLMMLSRKGVDLRDVRVHDDHINQLIFLTALGR